MAGFGPSQCVAASVCLTERKVSLINNWEMTHTPGKGSYGFSSVSGSCWYIYLLFVLFSAWV